MTQRPRVSGAGSDRAGARPRSSAERAERVRDPERAARGQRSGQQRRRGAQLEAAILDAVLDVLQDKGYAGLTYEAVAARAATSRSVVYRRWPSRELLVIAAMEHVGATQPVPLPDTGSLRDDLVEMMASASQARASLVAPFVLQLAPFYLETGRTPMDLRKHVLGQRVFGVEQLLERAVERGEIPPDRLTPRLRALPGDLMRGHMMQTLASVPRETIEGMVDEIIVPLLTR